MYWNDDAITVYDINHTRGSFPTYAILYIVEWVYNQIAADEK